MQSIPTPTGPLPGGGRLVRPIRRAGMLALALLGAAVATFCDLMHVQTGTLVYPEPVFMGQAWWPFAAFTLAFLWMAILYRLLDRLLPAGVARHEATSRGGARELTESLLHFAFVYLLSGFGNGSPVFLSAAFYATFALRFAVARERLFLSIVAVNLAIGGTLSEGAMSALGMVAYTRYDFLLVPAWLPGLYLHGAFALRDGYRFFVAEEA